MNAEWVVEAAENLLTQGLLNLQQNAEKLSQAVDAYKTAEQAELSGHNGNDLTLTVSIALENLKRKDCTESMIRGTLALVMESCQKHPKQVALTLRALRNLPVLELVGKNVNREA